MKNSKSINIALFFKGLIYKEVLNDMSHKTNEERVAWEVGKIIRDNNMPYNYQYTVLVDEVLLYNHWALNEFEYKTWQQER